MIKVVLLGAGNVATHLSKALLKAKAVKLIQVYSRKKSSLENITGLVDKTTNLGEIKAADIYIIAIPDDEITLFSSKLPIKDSLVVHTSGSVALSKLHGKFRKGVFYPLQTFSKKVEVSFLDVPLCIEAKKENDLILLEKLASSISNNVYFIDSEQRKSLHTAAVVVNNFVNHLYHIGYEICEKHKVPFEILEPLIKETAKKIETISPYNAQTGPARRNDERTIESHLKLLNKKQQEIYKLLTESIKDTYGKKL